jgi:hypothetical protein
MIIVVWKVEGAIIREVPESQEKEVIVNFVGGRAITGYWTTN